MPVENLYQELVSDCQTKLERELTTKEMELISWIQEQHLESYYQNIKSS